MVAKPHRLAGTVRAIELVLKGLLDEYPGSEYSLRENKWGHLSLVVGSDRFKDMPERDRRDTLWNHLQSNLDPKDFGQFSEAFAVDLDEYRQYLDSERLRSGLGDDDSDGLEDFPS